MAAPIDPYNFSDLLAMDRSELRVELVHCVEQLATAIEHAAFVKSTDGRNSEFFEAEGHRDALNEQKWLIMRLMDSLYG